MTNQDQFDILCGNCAGINMMEITPDDVRDQGAINGATKEEIEQAIEGLFEYQIEASTPEVYGVDKPGYGVEYEIEDDRNIDEMDFEKIWREGNDSGLGFSVGDEDTHINDLRGELGELLIPAESDTDVAVYRDGKTVTIVGDSDGPWAVQA